VALGIRGTVFDLLVEAGRTIVILREGVIVACPIRTPQGCTTLATPGQVVIVTPSAVESPARAGPLPTQFTEQCLSPIDRAACQFTTTAELSPPPPAPPGGGQPAVGLAEIAITSGAAGIVTGGIVAKKPDRISVPMGLQAFPPSPPSPTPVPATTVPATIVPPPATVEGSQSFTAGGLLGYNAQFGNVVVGIEGDAAWKKLGASNSETITSTATYAVPVAIAQRTEIFSGQVGQGWDASLRARLGAFVTPAIQSYVTGGVAFGNVNGAFSYSATMNLCNAIPVKATCVTPADLSPLSVTQTTSGAGSWSDTRVGWTMGSGIDFNLGWGGWKARLEYDYTNFGSISHNIPLTRTCSQIGNPGACGAIPNTGAAFATVTQQAAFQTVRLGLVYSFNGFDIGGFVGRSGD
jgi:outer membrane immunogenic protein